MKKRITLGFLVFSVVVLSTYFVYQLFENKYLADQIVTLTTRVLPSMTLTSITIDKKAQSLDENTILEAMAGQKITLSGIMPSNAKLLISIGQEQFKVTPLSDGHWEFIFRPNNINLTKGDYKISYYVSDDEGYVTPKKTIKILRVKDNTLLYGIIRFVAEIINKTHYSR